ncbi:extracellular catalytic domain type 1 short-chain-length polyhydroxyalkanoate depolymerase [Noviherbaspirillum pedocola]|uniref:PHB depolymerase family esterase n=1 Tax=Noviherbaspirillum pedocola TaxID=2801341 RepID=A0A934SZB5_9BURK|nr:PHB depolymerase family esterase [Noviherbaspirillum pedocola]MBK4738065.1 PHB depolymerase family esterase [Noviherbaspirillum pedocola]
MKLNEDFLTRMQEATSLLHTAGPAAATAAIQRALGIAGGEEQQAEAPARFVDINPEAARPEPSKDRVKAPGEASPAHKLWRRTASMFKQNIDTVETTDAVSPDSRTGAPGRFLSGSFSNRAGTRAYRLYVPAKVDAAARSMPLVVMLHGCKQNPEDFAAGTRMNQLAEQHGFLVLYPAQQQRDNGSNCWNWFQPGDQRRDHGEPSILAGMTEKIIREYGVDADKVYVAGLSAGGAMAAILADTHPDVYAAVGIHSGLPAGCARDVASAFGAMKGGRQTHVRPYRHRVPAIVFHGDRDRTVHPDNGSEALAQSMGMSLEAWRAHAGAGKNGATRGRTGSGRTYTQSVYHDDDGKVSAEHWLIHGAGHAWSGGSTSGSYTDPKGPDASAEMLRFFLAHPKRTPQA